jgi:hypothetical protein
MTGQNNPILTCTRHVMVLGKANRLEAALDESGSPSVLDELNKWMNSPKKSKQKKFDDLEQVLFEFGDNPHSMLRQDINYLENNIWELKHGDLRVLFGGGICDHSMGDSRSTRALIIPSFLNQPDAESTCGRGTNTFTKKSKATPRRFLHKAEGIIKKDKNQ